MTKRAEDLHPAGSGHAVRGQMISTEQQRRRYQRQQVLAAKVLAGLATWRADQ